MIKIVKYFFQAIIIYFFFIIIKLIGISLSRIFFSFLFNKVGPLIKSDRVVNDNLEKFLGTYNKDNDEKIKHSNKPGIFISGHFANFELMSMELTKRNIKLATIYRPLNNFFLNPFMEYVRRKYVCSNQIKKGLAGVKSSIKHIQNNFSIALMIDQRVSEGKKLPFFGHMALTTTLPAQLASKYQLDIVPIYISRNKNDNFEMEIFEPIQISKKEDSEVNKLNLTIRLNRIMEQMVSKDPGQWIWTHDRWK